MYSNRSCVWSYSSQRACSLHADFLQHRPLLSIKLLSQGVLKDLSSYLYTDDDNNALLIIFWFKIV